MAETKRPLVEELPDYLRGEPADLKVGLDDLTWIGPDGNEDHSGLVDQSGYEPETPLEILVRAVIAGSRPSGVSDGVWAVRAKRRERQALKGLRGSSRAGRDEADDSDLLLEIARRYFAEFWERSRRQPSEHPHRGPVVAHVVRDVIYDGHPAAAQRGVEIDNLRAALARKFRAQKDLLLVRVSSDREPDRMDRARHLREALAALSRAGVPCDLRVLRTRLGDANP